MTTAIYILKMIICGHDHSKLSAMQFRHCLDLGYFIICIFARHWFAAGVAADAPMLTLRLWEELQQWKARDPKLAKACTEKLKNHTWYLSGRHVTLALFSDKVDDQTKRQIADMMLKPENKVSPIPPGKPELPRFGEGKKAFQLRQSRVMAHVPGYNFSSINDNVL